MAHSINLLATIGMLAIGWYLFCIVYVGLIAPDPPSGGTGGGGTDADGFRQFVTGSITTLSGTLATFVGMVLGFGQAGASDNLTSGYPLAAAVVYVFSLILAICIWWYRIHANKACDPVIVNLGQSFIGLIGGAMAVMLNVKK
jgi:hypothetical protein